MNLPLSQLVYSYHIFYTADPFDGALVMYTASQSVDGIGGVNDHAAFLQRIHHGGNFAGLRIFWMNR